MITAESNRTQATGAPPFEGQAQAGQAPSLAERPTVGERIQLPVREPFWFLSLVVAGATIGSMWALGAVVLGILGLAGLLATYMFSVAAITLGSAFLMLAAVGRVWTRMFRFEEYRVAWDRFAFSTGQSLVVIAGLAAIALGILHLLFPAATVLGGVAILALGAGLVCHSAVMRRIGGFTSQGVGPAEADRPVVINALSVAPVRDFLVGLGVVALGVLTILGLAPMVLGLVAVLALGGAVTLAISTICGASVASLRKYCAKS